MKIGWDPRKAALNVKKHAVSFEEAASALGDPFSLSGYDPDHSRNEHRFVTFGMSIQHRLLTISHTENSIEIRIISARLANKKERVLYEEG